MLSYKKTSMVRTTWVYQSFPTVKFIESTYRPSISDWNLQGALSIKYTLDFKDLV